ncbi:MAG TPA: LOG family protein [Opitutales bacterium]|nr:LOG family protein [Opitutales bacterium]
MTSPSKDSFTHWPLKAYNNTDFLNSDGARNIRILCEMTEPRLRFQEKGIKDTIVIFGSARLRTPEQARGALKELEDAIKDPDAPTPAEKAALHTAECGVRAAPYYTAAVELAEKLTKWSLEREAKGKSPYTICSGGGPGIMEAANLGAEKAGGKSVGLGISLPFEQGVNQHVPEDLKFEFHYFFVRKFWFVSMAKVLVAFPGGFGTLDELFETLTLVQTKKIEDKPVIVLFGSEFWNEIVNFDALVKWGVISPDDINLFKIIDDIDEAADAIISGLEERFG